MAAAQLIQPPKLTTTTSTITALDIVFKDGEAAKYNKEDVVRILGIKTPQSSSSSFLLIPSPRAPSPPLPLSRISRSSPTASSSR